MNESQSEAVRVLCFGWLRDRLGTETLVREKVRTVLDLWSVMTREQPDLRDAYTRFRAARNLAYCDWQTPVEPGDEVAFMPPVTGGSVDGEAVPQLHAALVTGPIDVNRLVAELRSDDDGALAAFVGAVRGTSQGRTVERLDYEAYGPMAEHELLCIATAVTERHRLNGVAPVHRIGSLAVGEVSVAVVAAAPHRQAALLARAEAVDALKQNLPVWKREHHPDGAVWVDTREHEGIAKPDGAAPPLGPGIPGTPTIPAASTPGHEPTAAPGTPPLSHLDSSGSFHMVDISDRPSTLRSAVAEAVVRFSDRTTLDVLRDGPPKGDVIAAARLAGIMGAKHTHELIPLCHPLPLAHLDLQMDVEESPPGIRIVSFARCASSTGVEMEALTAASVAGLTVIDMLKSVDPWITAETVAPTLQERRPERRASASIVRLLDVGRMLWRGRHRVSLRPTGGGW
jgi:molybdenum cofactor biosynthesis protein MoaC